MGLDLSSDWQLIDDLQTVSYQVKQGEGKYATAVSLSSVYKEHHQKDRGAPDGGAFGGPVSGSLKQGDVSAFHFWTAKLNGLVPKIGDRVTASAAGGGTATYVVTEVNNFDLDATGVQRYRCPVLKTIGS